MKILVLNGPNLNLLGLREPEIYGNETYSDLVHMIKNYCDTFNIIVQVKQTNHEGILVDWIQEAHQDQVDGIIINPAAYTHTSIAILDALKAVDIPTIEVHISDPGKREAFREVSYIHEICIDTVKGEGLQGYITAIEKLNTYIQKSRA